MKIRNILTVFVAVLAFLFLFGCTTDNFQVVDGPGMVYNVNEEEIDYAAVFDFDSWDGQPYFAVAFLGYGDRMDFRNAYVEGIFSSLSAYAIDNIEHIAYEGDEWYLIVPRYKYPVYIENLETEETYTVYDGKAFTVNCNLSDLYSNIHIYTEEGFAAYGFSPQMGGDGRLITGTDVHDITDYSVMDENLYVQGGE